MSSMADVLHQARRHYIDVSDPRSAISSTAKNGAFPGERPTLSDWPIHLSKISPGAAEALLKARSGRAFPEGGCGDCRVSGPGLLYDETRP